MSDKEAVRALEPHATIDRTEEGYAIRKHPEGRVLGAGCAPAKAWRNARMNLFAASIGHILSAIPAKDKQNG